MSSPLFIAIEPFSPANGDAWIRYVEWSKLTQLVELVTLDAMLCPPVLKEIKDEYWPNIVNENYLLNYFTDLEFLRSEIDIHRVNGARICCVYRNPIVTPDLPLDLQSFRFRGFDLVELETGTSALTNCGGWPELNNSELSQCGLIEDHGRAMTLRDALKSQYPEEPHAACDLWAIFTED